MVLKFVIWSFLVKDVCLVLVLVWLFTVWFLGWLRLV